MTSSKADAEKSSTQRLTAKDANDALGQRTAIGSHGKDRRAAPFLHQGESACVFHRISAERDRNFIAAVFPFGANPFVQPPDRGMIKEQRLHANLKHIHERVEAPD